MALHEDRLEVTADHVSKQLSLDSHISELSSHTVSIGYASI